FKYEFCSCGPLSARIKLRRNKTLKEFGIGRVSFVSEAGFDAVDNARKIPSLRIQHRKNLVQTVSWHTTNKSSDHKVFENVQDISEFVLGNLCRRQIMIDVKQERVCRCYFDSI